MVKCIAEVEPQSAKPMLFSCFNSKIYFNHCLVFLTNVARKSSDFMLLMRNVLLGQKKTQYVKCCFTECVVMAVVC